MEYRGGDETNLDRILRDEISRAGATGSRPGRLEVYDRARASMEAFLDREAEAGRDPDEEVRRQAMEDAIARVERDLFPFHGRYRSGLPVGRILFALMMAAASAYLAYTSYVNMRADGPATPSPAPIAGEAASPPTTPAPATTPTSPPAERSDRVAPEPVAPPVAEEPPVEETRPLEETRLGGRTPTTTSADDLPAELEAANERLSVASYGEPIVLREGDGATWSDATEIVTPDGATDRAVEADLEPVAGLPRATLILRRNLDPDVPAAMLVDLIFDEAPSVDGVRVEVIGALRGRSSLVDVGTTLVSVPAKVSGFHFVIALNEAEPYREENLRRIRATRFLEIPLVLEDGTVRPLLVEKRTLGNRVLGDVTASWNATARR